MSDYKIAKIIKKKRDGKFLSTDDIAYFINCVVKSTKDKHDASYILDRCQIGAMLMAIYLKGFNSYETSELTTQMRMFGEVFEWPNEWNNLVVDKHSTGGVGDKVSLILAPALAALGLKVPMISGRALSHTGGTLDKLESIPGFCALLTKDQIFTMIETVGCCIVGQTDDCVPADKVLYHCREITATVDFPPFIIASIASKKLSEGLHSLVYDVKFGKGSNFKTKEEALQTAKSLVQASRSVNTAALFTSMETPLGKTIGNSVEVIEAIDCLKGNGPNDVLEIVSALGAELLRLSKEDSLEEGRKQIFEALRKGDALKKFHQMIICQGVSKYIADELCFGNATNVLQKTPHQRNICYFGEEGYITEIDPLRLANIWKEESYFSHNNPAVGLTLLKTVGDKISSGDAWLRFYMQREELTKEQETILGNTLTVSSSPTEKKLIEKRIYFEGDSLAVKEY